MRGIALDQRWNIVCMTISYSVLSAIYANIGQQDFPLNAPYRKPHISSSADDARKAHAQLLLLAAFPLEDEQIIWTDKLFDGLLD